MLRSREFTASSRRSPLLSLAWEFGNRVTWQALVREESPRIRIPPLSMCGRRSENIRAGHVNVAPSRRGRPVHSPPSIANVAQFWRGSIPAARAMQVQSCMPVLAYPQCRRTACN